jgi:hypothetical protein
MVQERQNGRKVDTEILERGPQKCLDEKLT